jgi:Restriction endonuclease
MDYLIPSILIIWTIWAINSSRKSLKTSKELSRKKHELEKMKLETENHKLRSIEIIEKEKQKFSNYQLEKNKEFQKLILETQKLKSDFHNSFISGRDWFAELYSEYIQMKDNELECSLIVKPYPAWKAADTVSAIKQSRKEMSKRLKFMEYQIKTYEEYFPQLADYKIAILDELIDFRHQTLEEDDTIDPALKLGYLRKEEYIELSNSDKFQLALDRYWKKKKSNLEIGRVYERYTGFLYESKGWVVKYEGIIKGFEDFGRDLICRKDDITLIIQCKCWAKEKVIREKYIMQLYGSTILYEYEHSLKNVRPIFYSTTDLSAEAKYVAERLDIEVQYENLKRYPMIKCNINHQTKEKIYHLPFDQQYDKIIIGDEVDEQYAETILEAENLGFRRAYRWKGQD